MISKSFLGSLYTNSRHQTSSFGLSNQPPRSPRHDQYEIFFFNRCNF
ncbi:MAG: hypothetical protein K9M81_01155 [Chthoniobacterales bacterium]|nr:hypothetical protein [Chthoniobacterales bacterium]